MRILALVILGVLLGRWLLVPILRRLYPRFAEPVRLASHVLVQLGVAAILGWVAVVLAQDHDALHLALAGFLGLGAAALILIQALVVWGYFRLPLD